MTAAARAALISFWILAVGLAAVGLEVEKVRSGVKIRNLFLDRDARVERFRRLEMRFNHMASPDLLERKLPEELRSPATQARPADPRA